MCDEQINEAQRGSWHRYSLRKTEMSALLCADTGLKRRWDGEG